MYINGVQFYFVVEYVICVAHEGLYDYFITKKEDKYWLQMKKELFFCLADWEK